MTEIGGKSFTTEMVRATTSAVESRLGDYAYVKRYIGTVSAIDTTAQTCSVKILGSTTESTGFSVRGLQFPNVNDNVSVCIAGQERWVESVFRSKASTEPFLYRSGTGQLATPNQLMFMASAESSIPLATQVSGHSTQDFYLYGDGKHTWGDGSNAHDVSLYRDSSSPYLRVDSTGEGAVILSSGSSSAVGYYAKKSSDSTYRFYLSDLVGGANKSGLALGDGTSIDVNLYRLAANALATDDSFVIGGQLYGATGDNATHPGLPYAMCSGRVNVATSGGSGSASVTFPVSTMFSVTPIVICTTSGGTSGFLKQVVHATGASTTGFTCWLGTGDGTTVNGTWAVDWIAIQMTSSSATG